MAIDKTSFTTAKRLVFNALLTATEHKEGQHAYLGHLPPRLGVWGITFGGGGDVKQTWNVIPPTELHMNADIEGLFKTQEAADETGMLLLSGLTIFRSGHVQAFRLRTGGMLDVFVEPRKIANEGPINRKTKEHEPIAVWVMRIGCELVFNTDGEDVG